MLLLRRWAQEWSKQLPSHRSPLCSKLDHLVLLGRPLLYSQKDPYDPFLHLHRFARIQRVLELLLRLYMRHQNFPLLLCLLFDPWVLEL